MLSRYRFVPVLAATLWLLAAALLVMGGSAGGARAGAPVGVVSQPRNVDPYFRLSGVITHPPSSMHDAGAAQGGGVNLKWAGRLTPPVFGPNVDASLNNSAAQNETTIAINPEDSLRVIGSANDYRNNLKPEVYLSSDGGTTWTNYQVPGVQSIYYGDPSMVFGTSSRAYFGYLGYAGSLCSGSGGMYVSRSTDAGATFSTPLLLASDELTGSVAILQDKEYVAVDNYPSSPYYGNVYEAWTRYAFQQGPNCGGFDSQLDAPIVLSRSTDHGATWTSPIEASPPYSNNNSAALPVVGHNGKVYLYYVGAQGITQPFYDTILFSKSTDGGQTWPFFNHIASIADIPNPLPHTSFRDNAFGAMAADQQLDGYLYAVWADYRLGDADILLSRSTDDGATWSAPTRLNDDPQSNGKDQFFPWISASPDGYIHVSWFDRREDPNDANYKEYYTYSSDHGATWAANVAVSTAPSVPGNTSFIGDYSGIASTYGVVMPIWTDIRSGGNENAYTARGVYTTTGATVTVTPPPITPSVTATSTSTPQPSATGTGTATPTIAIPPTEATGTPSSTPCVMSFSDVQPSDYFYEDVRCIYCLGAISGYADGTFRPFNNTTRGQMVKIIVLAFRLRTITPTGTPTFNDVPPGSPFYDYVETAAANNIVSGYADGSFRPNNFVTRGQLCKIVTAAASHVYGWTIDNPATPSFSDVPPGSAFYEYIETSACHGIISGYADGTFRPYNNSIRAQIAKIVCRAVQNPPDDCTAPTATPESD